MTNGVDDHASSLEGASKDILTIHGAHTQFRTELQQGLETADAKLEAAMPKLGGIPDRMQAFDASKPLVRYPRPDRHVRAHKPSSTTPLRYVPSSSRFPCVPRRLNVPQGS